MNGVTGVKNATALELRDALATALELRDALAVMYPFHIVRLAGDARDRSRRRVQQGLPGHRSRTGDPLYARRAGPCTLEQAC